MSGAQSVHARAPIEDPEWAVIQIAFDRLNKAVNAYERRFPCDLVGWPPPVCSAARLEHIAARWPQLAAFFNSRIGRRPRVGAGVTHVMVNLPIDGIEEAAISFGSTLDPDVLEQFARRCLETAKRTREFEGGAQ